MTIVGDINIGITWHTNENLGTIDNGGISELFIQASAISGVDLQYRFKEGGFNKLPQGLSLLPSGNIIGKVSYQTFGIISFRTTADDKIHKDLTQLHLITIPLRLIIHSRLL